MTLVEWIQVFVVVVRVLVRIAAVISAFVFGAALALGVIWLAGHAASVW